MLIECFNYLNTKSWKSYEETILSLALVYLRRVFSTANYGYANYLLNKFLLLSISTNLGLDHSVFSQCFAFRGIFLANDAIARAATILHCETSSPFLLSRSLFGKFGAANDRKVILNSRQD